MWVENWNVFSSVVYLTEHLTVQDFNGVTEYLGEMSELYFPLFHILSSEPILIGRC